MTLPPTPGPGPGPGPDPPRPDDTTTPAPADTRGLAVGLVLLLCLAALGGVLALVFTSFLGGGPPTVAPEERADLAAGPQAFFAARYMPPRPAEAPESIHAQVMLGYRIMNDTHGVLPAAVGDGLSCSSCHFDGGISRGGRNGGLSLVGVSAKYPVLRRGHDAPTDLVARIDSCFERSMNGRALAPGAPEMAALLTYFHWISRGVPIYAEVPWLGIDPLPVGHRPDAVAGEALYAAQCAKCHGGEGLGTLIAPPLWGPHSFNDGAGMHRPEMFAAFTHLNMPKGNPGLTVEEAIDVAAFVTTRPRPRFTPRPAP